MSIKNIYHENLGTVNQNKVRVELENGNVAELYFSYDTIVSVQWNDHQGHYRKYVSVNYWSRTTGKLLNKLMADKTTRSSKEDFKMAVDAMFAFLNS